MQSILIAKTFKDYCRENTGTHFLDSGCAYGRHWEKGAIAEDAPGLVWRAKEPATIMTWRWLEAHFTLDDELQQQFEAWASDESRAEMSRFEAGADFAEKELKLQPRGRDNTYNGESDLSQCLVWQVYDSESKYHDWIYAADSTVTVIHIHTGCDVRGGYTRPLFCRPRGDYAAPIDVSAGYSIAEARRPRRVKYLAVKKLELFEAAGVQDPAAGFEDGPDELDDGEIRELDEKWQTGYSRYTYGKLDDDVARWFEHTRTQDSVCVKLVTGEVAKVQAWMMEA